MSFICILVCYFLRKRARAVGGAEGEGQVESTELRASRLGSISGLQDHDLSRIESEA